MKPSVLQNFVRDWLAVRGMEPEVIEPDVWQFPVPKDLRERFGREEMTFSFSRRAIARNPKSELATVGNPIFDRLLSVARDEGRIGIGFVKPASTTQRAAAHLRAKEIDGVAPAPREPVYQGIYHLVFTISYPSIESADEMEVVSVDGATLEVWAQTPDLAELWTTLETESRKGRSVLSPLPVSRRVLDTALHAFERRMRRRIKKVEQASQERLEEETESIRAYYEQLIEEARNQSRRWSTRVEDREDRIRWLQLEWKRRIEEANEFWKPTVNARLVAMGIQMQPRTAFRFAHRRPAKSGRGAVVRNSYLIWDDASRTMLAPYCEECGRAGLAEPHLHPNGGFICAECDAKRKSPQAPAGSGGDGSTPTLTRSGADR